MKTQMGFLRLLAALSLAALLAGCAPGIPAVIPPGPSSWQVERILAEVWAATDLANPNNMPRLNDNAAHTLVDGGGVTTDIGGEAHLYSDTCKDVHIYQVTGLDPTSGQLVFRACAKETLGTCSQVLSTSCDGILVVSLPGSVTLTGSWGLIIYSDRLQLLMVAAVQGSASIFPADNHPSGCSQRNNIPQGQFAYIFLPERAGDIQALVPGTRLTPCQAQPIAQMSPFVNALGINAQMQSVNRSLRGSGLRPTIPEQ